MNKLYLVFYGVKHCNLKINDDDKFKLYNVFFLRIILDTSFIYTSLIQNSYKKSRTHYFIYNNLLFMKELYEACITRGLLYKISLF